MDRHATWRRVKHDFDEALERRPNGYLPVVQVHVAGRLEPLELGFVETRRGANDTWVRLQSGWESAEASNAIGAHAWFHHVPESAILGVEVVFRKEGTGAIPIGFRYEEVEDEEPLAAIA
jgi:hypothetical protein